MGYTTDPSPRRLAALREKRDGSAGSRRTGVWDRGVELRRGGDLQQDRGLARVVQQPPPPLAVAIGCGQLDLLRGPARSPAQVLGTLLAGADEQRLAGRVGLLRGLGTPWLVFLRHLHGCSALELHRLFRAVAQKGPAEEGAAVLGARFGVSLECSAPGAVPWCWPTLLRLWAALAALPESAVARNPALCKLVRVDAADGWGAYHDHRSRSPLGPRSAEVGVVRPDSMSTEYRVPVDQLSATVWHEVGHAVAVRLGLHDTLYGQVPRSPWVFQGDRRALLHRVLGAEQDLGQDPHVLRLCELYLHQPGRPRRSLRRALSVLTEEERRAGRRGPPLSLLRLPAVRYLGHNCRFAVPCYHGLRHRDDGVVYYYDSGYRRAFGYRLVQSGWTQVSAYQLRAPNEWFTELYVVYYADTLEGGLPGRRLRRMGRSLAAVARWFDEHVHV